MRREAIEKIRSVLGNFELLSLDCDFGDYWAINVLDVLDCIDYENAEFVRFSKKNENEIPRIMTFIKYAFHLEKLRNNHIFKVIDCPKAAIFVDDVFVKEVAKHNITGFKFKLVWEG